MNPAPKTPVSKPTVRLPANDNKTASSREISEFLRELIPQDDAAADAICRRGERMANAILVVMATCMVAFPLLYAGLVYAGIAVVP